MQAQALVQELRENILYDRSDRVDGVSDKLWSNATLYRYVDEAQRRFARQTFVLRDNVSEVTRVALIAGVTEYILDPAVLSVVSARCVGDARDLVRGGHAALDQIPTPDFLIPGVGIDLTAVTGRPVAFTTDESIGTDDSAGQTCVTLRVYPTPDTSSAGLVLQMRVVRLPLEPIAETAPTAVPEIPEDYHLDMLDWAAYLALRIVDHDAGDMARALQFRASFDEHVERARKALRRKQFAPMQWGFGRHGFSWTH